MEKVRLGTCGSGFIVHNILDGVKAAGISKEDFEVSAVYSRSLEKAQALAEEYEASTVYTDYDQLLSDPVVNTIYIATPNSCHYEQAKKALLTKKNVLLEKPFCTRFEEAKELFDLAEQNQVILYEMVPFSFAPNLQLIEEYLPQIGPVRLVLGNFSQYSSRYDKFLSGETPNVFSPEFAGGAFMDLNFYNLYLTLTLFGLPKAAVYLPVMERGIDISGCASLLYEGFSASLSAAKCVDGENFYQIEGEKGYLYISGGPSRLASVRLVTKTSDETRNLQGDTDCWTLEMKGLIPALLRADKEYFEKKKEITLQTVCVMEETRKKAGLFFPADVH